MRFRRWISSINRTSFSCRLVTRGYADIDAELVRDDTREGGFAEARWPRKKAMVKSVTAVLGSLDVDGKTFLDVFLAGEFGKAGRSQILV